MISSELIERISNKPQGKQVLTFYSKYHDLENHPTGPSTSCEVILSVGKSKVTGKPVGIENLTEEEKRNTKDYINPEIFSQTIKHKSSYDLSDPYQLLIVKAIAPSNLLASSRDEADSSPSVIFYAHIEDDEDDKIVSRLTKKAEAMAYVSELGMGTKIYDLALLLGENCSALSPPKTLGYLHSVIDKSPERILVLKNDGDSEVKLSISKLLDSGILKQSKDFVYSYNGSNLATNQKGMIAYMKKNENKGMIDNMLFELYEKEDDKKKK